MAQCWCLGLTTEAGFPVWRMESLNSGYLESLFYNVGDGVMKVLNIYLKSASEHRRSKHRQNLFAKPVPS
jgi:hypothetical protein